MNIKDKFDNLFKKVSESSSFRVNRVILLIFFAILISIAIFIVSTIKESSDSKKAEVLNNYFDSEYVPDELIVKLKTKYTEEELKRLDELFDSQNVIGQKKAYLSDKPYLANYYLLRFKPGTNLKNVKKEFDSTGLIEISHPNYIFEIQDKYPNDPFYPQQWDLVKIGMPAVWDLTGGAENIRVAVIDTGIDFNHDELTTRKVVKGHNFAYCEKRDSKGFCITQPTNNPLDDHGHGTHVAGTIGAAANNSKGTAGMLWSTTLIAIKAMKSDGKGTLQDIVNAIEDAMSLNAKVINLSLTSGKGSRVCASVPELQHTINDAVSKGIVVVVAAGNQNQDASSESPPSCSGVIVVGATNSDDKRWVVNSELGSNYGSRVDISAPGTNIISIYSNNRYAKNEGTSMAAPHVAAAAAMLLSLNPSLTPQAILNCLVSNADPIQTDKPIGKRLNVNKAVRACTQTTPPAQMKITVPQATPSAIGSGTTQTTTNTTSPTTTTNKVGPTPVKTYTCRQAGGSKPNGAIQIGNLICTPN